MTITQPELNFTSGAPINTEKLTGQNRLVYDILRSGKTLTCYQAQDYGITALNSRIKVYDRFITTSGGSKVKEYSLTKFSKHGIYGERS